MSFNHKLVLLPCLDAKMRLSGASNEALSVASGVNMRSIAMSRSVGRGMHVGNGVAVYQALNEGEFAYRKRGPKGK
jgi:hypothetical protein